MKNALLLVATLSLMIFISCGGDSAEDLKVDCSKSSLEVVEVSTTDADCGDPGSMEVSSNGGSGKVQFSVDEGEFQSSGIFSLAAGTYSVTASDASECTASKQITIGSATGSVSISTITSTDSGCKTSNAMIEVSATGGDENFMYQLDNGTFQSSNSFGGLSAGTYAISVKDSEGCTTQRDKKVLTGVKLSNAVMPLLGAKCATAGCHNGNNGASRNFTIKTNVLDLANSIKELTQIGAMPPAGSISQEEKNLIACWVEDGALDN